MIASKTSPTITSAAMPIRLLTYACVWQFLRKLSYMLLGCKVTVRQLLGLRMEATQICAESGPDYSEQSYSLFIRHLHYTSARVREITFKPDFESWRAVARQLLKDRVPASEVRIMDCEQDSTLWTAEFVSGNGGPDPQILIPRRFIDIAKHVACHINPLRWQLLYSVLWRLCEKRDLLKVDTDDEVKTILFMDQQVRRDLERMQTGVKFEGIQVEPGHERLIAWRRPDYAIMELAAPYFAERFARSQWSILTPYRSAHWDPESKKLEFTAG